jgi:hypothetical protein
LYTLLRIRCTLSPEYSLNPVLNGEECNFNYKNCAIVNAEPIRSTGVETPNLSAQTFTYSPNGYIITIPEAEGASSYEWSTQYGTISGTGTSVTLYSDCSTNVSVRAYNEQCEIQSSWNTKLVTINYGSISGSTIICSSSAYSISNLPSGATVSWSLTPHASTIQLQQNIPATNMCLISNPHYYPATMTLTATITTGCGIEIEVTKTVVSDTNSTIQNGSYYQEACTFYGVSHPSQSGTLDGNAVFLHQGCMTEVTLSNMVGRKVSLSSGAGQPMYWYYNNDTHILYLQLPYLSGGVPFIFNITGDGACNQKSVLFFSYGNNRSALVIYPNPASTETTIMLEPVSEESITNENDEWELEIFDQSMSLKLKKEKLKSKEIYIKTAGWKEGVYIVRVKYKDEVLQGKLVVK